MLGRALRFRGIIGRNRVGIECDDNVKGKSGGCIRRIRRWGRLWQVFMKGS